MNSSSWGVTRHMMLPRPLSEIMSERTSWTMKRDLELVIKLPSMNVSLFEPPRI